MLVSVIIYLHGSLQFVINIYLFLMMESEPTPDSGETDIISQFADIHQTHASVTVRHDQRWDIESRDYLRYNRQDKPWTST